MHTSGEGKDTGLFRSLQTLAAAQLLLDLCSFEMGLPLVLATAVYTLLPLGLLGRTGFTSTQQTANNNNNRGNTAV